MRMWADRRYVIQELECRYVTVREIGKAPFCFSLEPASASKFPCTALDMSLLEVRVDGLKMANEILLMAHCEKLPAVLKRMSKM